MRNIPFIHYCILAEKRAYFSCIHLYLSLKSCQSYLYLNLINPQGKLLYQHWAEYFYVYTIYTFIIDCINTFAISSQTNIHWRSWCLESTNKWACFKFKSSVPNHFNHKNRTVLIFDRSGHFDFILLLLNKINLVLFILDDNY